MALREGLLLVGLAYATWLIIKVHVYTLYGGAAQYANTHTHIQSCTCVYTHLYGRVIPKIHTLIASTRYSR